MKTRLFLFYCAIVFVIFSVYATRPMTSLFAEELGASMVVIGLLTSCFSIVPLLIAIASGKLIDRFGERMPLIIGSVGMIIALILPFLYPSLISLFVMQFLLGGSQLLAVLSTQNGVQKTVTLEERDKAVGNFSLFTSLGMLVGPLSGGYLTEIFGYQNTFIILALACFVSLICAFFLSKPLNLESEPVKQIDKKVTQFFYIPGFTPVLLISMLSLSSLDIFYSYFPLYAQTIGMSLSQIGWILAILALSNALTRMFLPSLVWKFGRAHVLLFSLILGATAYGVFTFFDAFTYILLISAFIGIGLGIIQPLTTILTYNFAPEGRTGEALGIRLASNRVGQITLPLIIGGLSSFTGLGAIFVISSVLLFAGAWSAKGILTHEHKTNSV